jgi:hypothetical protein
MAPLQKRALYGLVIGICLAVAILALFLLKGGINRFDTDQGFRLIIDALWIAGLVLPLVLFWPITQKPVMFDERDRIIMARSSRVQWLAVIISLVLWLIILSEAYHIQRLVPLSFLYVMVISIFIISTLAQSLGILIGYWRVNRNG